MAAVKIDDEPSSVIIYASGVCLCHPGSTLGVARDVLMALIPGQSGRAEVLRSNGNLKFLEMKEPTEADVDEPAIHDRKSLTKLLQDKSRGFGYNA